MFSHRAQTLGSPVARIEMKTLLKLRNPVFGSLVLFLFLSINFYFYLFTLFVTLLWYHITHRSSSSSRPLWSLHGGGRGRMRSPHDIAEANRDAIECCSTLVERTTASSVKEKKLDRLLSLLSRDRYDQHPIPIFFSRNFHSYIYRFRHRYCLTI